MPLSLNFDPPIYRAPPPPIYRYFTPIRRLLVAHPLPYPSIKNVYYDAAVVIEGDNHENRLRVIAIGGCLFAKIHDGM